MDGARNIRVVDVVLSSSTRRCGGGQLLSARSASSSQKRVRESCSTCSTTTTSCSFHRLAARIDSSPCGHQALMAKRAHIKWPRGLARVRRPSVLDGGGAGGRQ